MTNEELNRELCRCGKTFFIEFFEIFNCVDWTSRKEVSSCKNLVFNVLKTKATPSGQPYAASGLNFRFPAIRKIWTAQQEKAALCNIVNSKALPPDVRKKAIDLLIKYFGLCDE